MRRGGREMGLVRVYHSSRRFIVIAQLFFQKILGVTYLPFTHPTFSLLSTRAILVLFPWKYFCEMWRPGLVWQKDSCEGDSCQGGEITYKITGITVEFGGTERGRGVGVRDELESDIWSLNCVRGKDMDWEWGRDFIQRIEKRKADGTKIPPATWSRSCGSEFTPFTDWLIKHPSPGKFHRIHRPGKRSGWQ